MASPNLTEIVTTTLRNRSGRIADNVSKGNALLARLNAKGRARPAEGGRTIVEELTYAENSTFKFYSGYEVLDISPSDVISAAEYNWKQAAVNVTISGLEQLQNSGKERMLNLLETRIENAERTMKNQLSQSIYGDGTGSSGKAITGLQAQVADSPATGTVGGINRANFSFWRNQVRNPGAAATAANIQGHMQQLWLAAIRGNDRPDIIVADTNYYDAYWSALTAIQRIQREDRGVAGFESLGFNSADVVFDGDSGIIANRMYFLNTDFIFWRWHPDRNMVPMENKTSINQDAMVVPLLFAGNLTMSNADNQGVLTDN